MKRAISRHALSRASKILSPRSQAVNGFLKRERFPELTEVRLTDRTAQFDCRGHQPPASSSQVLRLADRSPRVLECSLRPGAQCAATLGGTIDEISPPWTISVSSRGRCRAAGRSGDRKRAD